MNTETPAVKVIKIFSRRRVAYFAGRRRLERVSTPAGDGTSARTEIPEANNTTANCSCDNLFCAASRRPHKANARIELYPIDFAAAQRDFFCGTQARKIL